MANQLLTRQPAHSVNEIPAIHLNSETYALNDVTESDDSSINNTPIVPSNTRVDSANINDQIFECDRSELEKRLQIEYESGKQRDTDQFYEALRKDCDTTKSSFAIQVENNYNIRQARKRQGKPYFISSGPYPSDEVTENEMYNHNCNKSRV